MAPPEDCMVDYGKGKERKEPMYIADDAFYSASDFIVPSHYKPYIEKILLPHGLVVDRVEKLAMDIHQHYFQKELHLLCVLKGSRGFFTLLINFLNKMQKYNGAFSSAPPYMEHYIRLKSYRNDSSQGKLQIIGDDLSALKGKHVLIVEDIIDTGYTLTQFGSTIKEYCPKSLKVASLLEKRTTRSNGFKGDFVAFSVADHYIVGFCYDFNEMFRDFDHVSVLSEAARKEFSV
uniref:Hypoxanthine phosphoribosyltransferase n=1 Tax=Sarcocystis neurona TaxID=42890 RepID=U3PSD5_SARNE|nr:hypoxanthine-xanthine-guanine phosphoribosyl transferase [Sarcocystis neurona]